MTMSGSSLNDRTLIIGFAGLLFTSTTGEKFQWIPTALDSFAIILPISYALSGSFVAAIAIKGKRSVPFGNRWCRPYSISASKRIGIFENEIIPEGKNLVGDRRARDVKITNQVIEAALGGQDLSAGIKVPGKKGSYIHLMHLADRSGPTLINELAYGPGDLNTLLANKNSGAEKFRTSLSKHMDKIAKNYKGKEFYNINSSKKSIDQTRFKEALELKFGTSKGKIPLKAYIDTILNEEARLMGIATDGLITMRPLDPLTLERMNPAFSTRGMGSDTTTTILDVAAEKQALGKGKFGAKTADLNLTANLAFNEVKNNLKTKDIQPIIDNIAAAMKGGLQNQTYEDIMALASQCSKLKTSGVYKFGGRVKLASGGSPCSNVVEAVKQLPDQEFKNLATNTPIATKVLNFLKGPGPKTFGIGAGIGAAVGLVKVFRNDDPTTYLSNEDQQKNMLVDMATQPVSIDIERPAILDYQLPALGASVVGSTALVAPSTIKASKSRALGIERKPPGVVKTGLRVLGRGLGVAASPALLAPLAAGDITSQIAEGDSPMDIATDPLNYLYPAFADQTPKLTRGLPSAFRKVARLGLSRPALRLLSRAGIGGFAASAAIQGLGLLDD